MLRNVLILGCAAWCVNITFAQQLTLDNIHFEGLKKNKLKFLQRIVDSRVGDRFSFDKVETDLRYLKQLNGINQASYQIDTTSDGISLIYQVEEAMSLFPIINFGGIQDNFWFQLGLTETNLFGKGSQLAILYRNNDNRHNFNVYYREPFIWGSRWGVSLGIIRWASVEPIYFEEAPVFYDLTNNSFAGSLFYQFKGNHFIDFGVTYFNEKFKKNSRHNNEVTMGPDIIEQPKLLLKMSHQANEVDYNYFYLDGFFNQANIETVWNVEENTWFWLAFNDLRFFKRLGKFGNLAFRLRLGLSMNSDNPFAPFVLDSHLNIRGTGNRIDRGTAAIILNAEYRHTIFENKTFGSQLVAFADSGTWRNPGGSFNDLLDSDNFRQFVGGGIRLIYKRAFNSMLRLDYGIDIYDINQRGFVIGFGQYF